MSVKKVGLVAREMIQLSVISEPKKKDELTIELVSMLSNHFTCGTARAFINRMLREGELKQVDNLIQTNITLGERIQLENKYKG